MIYISVILSFHQFIMSYQTHSNNYVLADPFLIFCIRTASLYGGFILIGYAFSDTI